MTDKLIVETFSSSIHRKRKLITECMMSNPEGCTPKMLACKTGINVNTIKSILPKLENIKRLAHGLYIVENRGDGTPTSDGTPHVWNFHNLVASFPVEKCKDATYLKDLKLVKLEFKVRNEVCTLRVSTDEPLNMSSIVLIHDIINATFMKELSLSEIKISTIEFNRDFEHLKLEGTNCLTLDTLYTEFKLYQKKRGLRVEHKTKVPFTAKTMVDVLTHPPNHLEVVTKLRETEAQLSKLTRQSIYNTQQLNKLIGGIR